VSVVALARHGLDGPVVITMCGEAKSKPMLLACLLLAALTTGGTTERYKPLTFQESREIKVVLNANTIRSAAVINRRHVIMEDYAGKKKKTGFRC